MGCQNSLPIQNEDSLTFVDGKSPFYIKVSVQTISKTPGGTKTKVKKYIKQFVPRLKSIDSSLLMTRRSNSFNSFSSIPVESYPHSSQTLQYIDNHYYK